MSYSRLIVVTKVYTNQISFKIGFEIYIYVTFLLQGNWKTPVNLLRSVSGKTGKNYTNACHSNLHVIPRNGNEM